MITRNPTLVADCGCPYDPDYDEGHLGGHLAENHPEWWFKLRTPFGTIRHPTAEECTLVGRDTSYSIPYTGNDYRELGDYVIDCAKFEPAQVERLAALCEELAIGDDVHVIPSGIYIEE